MKENIHINIEEIVRDSENLNNFDKDVLNKIFRKLDKKQTDLFKELEGNAEKQFQKSDDIEKLNNMWKIVFALIDADKQYAEWHEVIEKLPVFNERLVFEASKPDAVAFLKCRYSEIGKYTGKTYKAKVVSDDKESNVQYTLHRYYGFIEDRERLLEKTAIQYGVERPVMFSPFSRRAVSVKIEEPDKIKDGANIDFMLEENGLSRILLSGKKLVWNVKIESKDTFSEPDRVEGNEVVPFFENVYEIYKFKVTEKQFVYANTGISDTQRYENSIYVNLTEGKTVESVDYSKITLEQPTENWQETLGDFYADNFWGNKIRNKERIRTEADVKYVISSFGDRVLLKKVTLNKDEKSVKSIVTYDKDDSYHYIKDKHLRSLKHCCYLGFEQSDHWLFEDYISYILSFMNYFYPEFYWVGTI